MKSNPIPIIVLPASTDSKTVLAAKHAGYLPILTDHPESVKVLLPGNEFIADDMLMSAMRALCRISDSSGRAYFTEELWARMKEREASAKAEVKSTKA